MKTFTLAAVVGVAVLAGYVAGIQTEATTHALQVSRITGTPYTQVLGLSSRFSLEGSAIEADETKDADKF